MRFGRRPPALSGRDCYDRFMCTLLKAIWSGPTDLPGPEVGNINNLRGSFTENTKLPRLLFGPYLDPKSEVWRTRPCLDPAWTLVSTLAIHVLPAHAVASPSQKLDHNMRLNMIIG
jgi:hypothetical protein